MISAYCTRCPIYGGGWCEYDFATDTMYPKNEGECPERMAEEMHGFDLTAFAREVHQNAVAHGWWEEERGPAEIRALIHSEWSEALEEARAGRPMVWHECMDKGQERKPTICEECSECISKKVDSATNCEAYNQKPEGIAVEMLDGVIRILDWMGKKGTEPYDMVGLMLLGCSCYAEDFGGDKPVDRLSVAEVVDVLHYYTAKSLNDDEKLMAAMGVAFEWLAGNNVDAVKIIKRKHQYNKTRPYKHGKKF